MMFKYAHLLVIPMGSNEAEYLRFTDAGWDYNHGGYIYLSGFLKSIPAIPQTSTIRENKVTFTLYDLDNSIITKILTQEWKHKKAILTRIEFDTDYSVLNAIDLYKGKLANFSQESNDETKMANFICKDFWASEVERGRRTNNTSQHQVDPTDDCFEMTPFASREMPWGRKGRGNVTNNGGRGALVGTGVLP